jgi:predicted Zn finger-like uncharacterized protein
MIEVHCTSCHTRYRIDEQVLPEGLPTFKCSRCGHVFSFEPRRSRLGGQNGSPVPQFGGADELSGESFAPDMRFPKDEKVLASAALRASSVDSRRAGTAADSTFSGQLPERAPASHLESHAALDEEPDQNKVESEASGFEQRFASATESNRADTISAPQPAPSPRPGAQQAGKLETPLFTSGTITSAPAGENLTFDFADEEPELDQVRFSRKARHSNQMAEQARPDSDGWEVGDDESISRMVRSIPAETRFREKPGRRSRRKIRVADDEPEFTDDVSLADEGVAPVYNRAMTHSARFFLLLILLAGLIFCAMTMLIHGAPATSSVALSHLPLVGERFAIPATPAKLVALRDVDAIYQHSKEGHLALVIRGTAENVGANSLRKVQLTAALRDGQRHSLAAQAVYCGNSVSSGMVSQMTPHEIEFFQKLEPAGTFALEPSASCHFVAVFMNPPGTAHSYDVSVSQAVPGEPPDEGDPSP